MKFVKLFVATWLLCYTVAGAFALEKKNFDISTVRENDKVYKIHGDNGGDTDYKCHSFESELNTAQQTYADVHSRIASYAYLDDSPAYVSANGVAVERKDAYKGTGYTPLSQGDTEKLIAGSGLKVDKDGMIYNPKQKDALNAVILKGEKGDVIISYRGTKEKRDILDDGNQVAVPKLVPQQYKDASVLLGSVLENTASGKVDGYSANTQITCDGHSLGGGLVLYSMASNEIGDRVVGNTYNSAGLSESTIESLSEDGVNNAADKITNYRNQLDPVSYVGYVLGPTYQVTTVSEGNKHTVLADHSIEHLTENIGAVNPENGNAKQQAAESVKPHATTQDSDADMTGSTLPSAESSLERLAEQLSKEYQNGESNVLPDDFFNDAYKNTLGEPKKNTDIAQTAYDDKISTLIEDKTVAQKVKDFVKGEIDKVVAKGEEWVENGGIRDAIKKGLDKILDGKVSDAQMQEILNLTDGLCNVNKDGGTSLIATLKTDGKDLAVSLAINELEKQLSNALPKDVADTLNSMLDVIADKGTAKDVRDALLLEAQKLVSKYVPYDNSAKTINGVLQDIMDGNAIDAMNTIKGLGVSVGADALKDVLSKNLPPEVADRINGLLDEFAQNGVQGLTDAAKNEIYGLIDQYAPGGDSAKQLKNVVDGVISGSVTGNDLKNAATSIVGDGAKGLINNSNLPQDVKNAANAAIDGLVQNGITGLTTNARDFISDYVADYLGDAAAGDAVGKIFDAVVTPGVDPWQEIVNQAPVIGAAIGHKVVAEVEKFAAAQIDKLIAKCPALQKVLNKLGINGAGIINGVKNVFSVLKNAPDLQTALTKLGDMAVNFLKDIAGKLIDWALEWAISWINNNIIPKVVDWASETLAKMAGSTNNELLQKGLAWLSDQVKNCKKCAAIKIKVDGTGAKIVDKVDQWIKNKQSTTTTILQTNGGKK